MEGEDNDDNTLQIGQSITILKPRRLSHRIILAYNCKGDILQLEEDILRQKNDDLKGSMCSVCFANLYMYMKKLIQ